MDQAVLADLRDRGPLHPRDLESSLGRDCVTNAWGSLSRATTHALQSLQWHGLVRVARRENGIRVYEVAPAPSEDRLSPVERFRKLVLVEAGVLAPVQQKTLQFLASGLRRISFPEAPDHRTVLRDLLRTGELAHATVDGISYVWPASVSASAEPPRQVRFLAPFDPLVWDRARFEHFWGWTYRFEAYTPQAKRVRGYYALPLLWGDHVIGWVNAKVTSGKLGVEPGFIDTQPGDKEFRRELDAEIARMLAFLTSTAIARPLSAPPRTQAQN